MQNQTSTELLLGIYLTNLNEEEEEEKEDALSVRLEGETTALPTFRCRGVWAWSLGTSGFFLFLLVVTHTSTFLPWCFHFNWPSI